MGGEGKTLNVDLCRALRCGSKSKVAVVGAGGKTSVIKHLARSLGSPVVITTTTHIGEWETGFADHHFVLSKEDDLNRIFKHIHGITLCTQGPERDGRLRGPSSEVLDKITRLCDEHQIPILIEADGSRQKPLKAPGEYEPVIPEWVNHVVVVMGMKGLNKPLDTQTVHRVSEFSNLSGLPIGENISFSHVAKVLCHPDGWLKAVPPGSKKSVVLNQIDEFCEYEEILRVVTKLETNYNSITLCSLKHNHTWKNIEPIAAIILAAGSSKRLGQAKLLLVWKGKPLIQHAVENTFSAGLNNVYVVVGAGEKNIRNALGQMPVSYVVNSKYQDGQSTSIRAGILALQEYYGAAIFILADQPNITPELIRVLIERHQTTQASIVAPQCEGKRRNPVLFDRTTFPDLLEITGDIGGRSLFSKFDIDMVNWNDPLQFLDVDTPGDYSRLLEIG